MSDIAFTSGKAKRPGKSKDPGIQPRAEEHIEEVFLRALQFTGYSSTHDTEVSWPSLHHYLLAHGKKPADFAFCHGFQGEVRILGCYLAWLVDQDNAKAQSVFDAIPGAVASLSYYSWIEFDDAVDVSDSTTGYDVSDEAVEAAFGSMVNALLKTDHPLAYTPGDDVPTQAKQEESLNQEGMAALKKYGL